MIKLKKILLTGLAGLFSAFPILKNTDYEAVNAAYNTVPIVHDNSAGSTDVAFVLTPDWAGNVSIAGGNRAKVQSILFGFDELPDKPIESIRRMHFRIQYLEEASIWDKIGNWFQNTILDKPNKHGTLKTKDVTVYNDHRDYIDYSFKWTKYIDMTGVHDNKLTYVDETKLTFKAIGKVADLLEAEKNARRFTGEPHSNDLKRTLTGGYRYDFNYEDRINDSSKSLAKRKWYAVVPINFAENIAYESIACTMVDGTIIDDGLDDNGNAFVDDETGDKYIDARPSVDIALAINGINAKLNRVEISGFTADSSVDIIIQNAGWNYDKQEPDNIVKQLMISGNEETTLGWPIGDNNRYIFIKWAGKAEEAINIKMRFYYSNENDSNAWRINLTDKDGNILPKPTPIPRPDKSGKKPDILGLLIFFSILFGSVILIITLLKILREVFIRRLV